MTEKQKILTQNYIRDCKMIRVERAAVDPDINYTGFPVWLSDSFLLMTNVYDFHDEGYVLLRTSDITKITAKDADFYEKICIQEVIYALSNFLIMILSWLVKQSLRAFLFQEVQL